MSPRRQRRGQGQDAPGTRRASAEWTPTGKRSTARRRNRDRSGRLDPRYRTSGTHRGTDRLREAVGMGRQTRQGTSRQRRRGRRLAGQGRRPWYAPAQWMWSKRPRSASTWTGLAGWLFVLAGIASFLAFKGTTSALTVGVCAVGWGVSSWLDHRERDKTYGRKSSESVRPMGRAEARQYMDATRNGRGMPPRQEETATGGRYWVSAHDREGTDGVTGHYRNVDSDAVREREQAQQQARDADTKTKRRARARAMPDIDGEWWEE